MYMKITNFSPFKKGMSAMSLPEYRIIHLCLYQMAATPCRLLRGLQTLSITVHSAIYGWNRNSFLCAKKPKTSIVNAPGTTVTPHRSHSNVPKGRSYIRGVTELRQDKIRKVVLLLQLISRNIQGLLNYEVGHCMQVKNMFLMQRTRV